MAHQTEAACLLETGALYETRVGLRPSSGDPIFAGFKPGAFSLYYGDAPIYHFDREGRWQRAFVAGIHYLKGLDTTVQAIDRVREGENLVLKRRTLSFAEASDLDATVRASALDLLDALGEGRLERVEPPEGKARPLSSDALREMLERAARWDAAAWFAHRERYVGTYGPLPFLPPDCPNAVILQATLGHAWGVSFGRGAAAEHYVRSANEFEEHARTVAELLGGRLSQCRAVFLGGSDVLRRPVDDVSSYLDTIARTFPILPESEGRRPRRATDAPPGLDGVHTFLDDVSPPRPGRDAWEHFRRLGLRRVSLGVESGDPQVRSLYGKTWDEADLTATVAVLKTAGLGVGVVTLAGAGGVEHADRHLARTVDLIAALDLGPGDLVSLLDAEEVRDPNRGDPPFTTPTAAMIAGQQAELKRRLATVLGGAKVVPYTLEKQAMTRAGGV
jgi:hypothetical protein